MSKNNSWFSSFFDIFGMAMVVFYFTIGIMLLTSNYFKYIDKNIKIVLATFFMAYGLFRLVRVILKIKDRKYEKNWSDNDENE